MVDEEDTPQEREETEQTGEEATTVNNDNKGDCW